MFVSREADYALRILRSLIDGKIRNVGEISELEVLPQPFAYKIIKKLAKNNIVKIIRGAAGGCQLVADLSKISLYEFINMIGEENAFISCSESNYKCNWREKNGRCCIHNKLEIIENKLNDELKSHSLLDILT